MMTPFIATGLVLVSGAGVHTGPAAAWLRARALEGPHIELWTDRNDGTVYHRGERVRVYFRADDDAYVTVFHIDTDGRVRVLFPEDPWEDNFARGRRAYEVRPQDERYAIYLDEYPGQGYVFAIATRDPFDYHAVVRGDHWDYHAIAGGGRISGDPYVAIEDLVDLIVPANYDAYSYDVASYYVEQYYEYPRFLCYDCHSYVSYPYWDPYHYSCIRFRIVIYDDPYYYPARAYPATRVVYRRVARVEPRYVFKDRGPTDTYVVRVRQRPAEEPAPRRAEERGVTGRDLGRVGTVPAPGVAQPPGRVREPTSTQGAEPAAAPARRPDPLIQPPGARQPPATTTVRPRAPGGATTPDRNAPEPRQLAPRAVEPRQPARIPDEGRPRLEPRQPPERHPDAGPAPASPSTRPPAAQPKEPSRKPETPQRKPEPPPRRRPDCCS